MDSSKLQKPSLKELTLNKSRIEQKCPRQKFVPIEELETTVSYDCLHK
jgi:hypothetical protein